MRSLACALALFAVASPALAQDPRIEDNRSRGTVSIEADNVPTGVLVRAIVSRLGGPRVELHPGLLPVISLRVKDATPYQALQALLAKLWARVRTEGGVWRIEPRPLVSEVRPRPPGFVAPRVTVHIVDWDLARAVAYLAGYFRQDIRLLGMPRHRITVALRDATLEEAIRAIVVACQPGLWLEPSVTGNVIVLRPLSSAPIDTGLPPGLFRSVDISVRDRPIRLLASTLSLRTGVRVRVDRDVPQELTIDLVARREPLWAVLERVAGAARLRAEVTGPNEVTLLPFSGATARLAGEPMGRAEQPAPRCRACGRSTERDWVACPGCGASLRQAPGT